MGLFLIEILIKNKPINKETPMFKQLLSILTPELIIQAVKDNPKVVIETLHKFDTFKLLGASLTTEQQVTISNNTNSVNQFLTTQASQTIINAWADEFTKFIDSAKAKVQEIEDAKIKSEELKVEARPSDINMAELRAKIEAEVRAEIAAKSKNEVNKLEYAKIENSKPLSTTEILAKIKAELDAKTKANSESVSDIEAKTKLIIGK